MIKSDLRRDVRRLASSLLLALVIVLGTVQPVTTATDRAEALKPTVILISLDGFRFDYLSRFKPPTLTAMARSGVRARWLIPSFPALTFPNHYTIATGLYPQAHGIVGNEIYDPILDARFSSHDSKAVQDGRWWGGQPIWVTAEKEGQHAACFFFPGCEAEISHTRAADWFPYDEKVPNEKRVATVLSWLDRPPATRPTFVALYFGDVDEAGHDSSPESGAVAEAVARVDRAVGQLVEGLKQRGIYDSVNLIVVSDHGMTTIRPQNVILLDDSFDSKDAKQVLWGAQLTQIFPREGQTRTIYEKLSRDRLKHARCYLKTELPARFHYQSSERIAPIVCLADEGWRIFQRKEYERAGSAGKVATRLIGGHGYDNQLRSMRATFIAHGPAFKTGIVVAPFANVSIYGIITRILQLNPAPNDGDPTVARRLLRQPAAK